MIRKGQGSVKAKTTAGRHTVFPEVRTTCVGKLCSATVVLLFCALLSPAAGITTVFAQQQAGFAGYAWGTPFDRMAGQFDLTPTLRREHTVQCSTNLRRIGKIGPIECEFEFTDGQFSGVILFAKRPQEASMLVSLLSTYYGERHIENPRACQWLTPETHAAYDEGSEGDAYVYIYARRFQSGSDISAP
jgi:hypothetical protein